MSKLFNIGPNDEEVGEGPPLTDSLRRTDEAIAHPRPDGIEFYVEKEYEHAEQEQLDAYAAKGDREARPPEKLAAELEHDADKAIALSDEQATVATDARRREKTAWEVLGPHLRRPTDAKLLKWMRWALILLGDLVGVAGAALLLGEDPFFAAIQALSVAASAITLGAVGREVRYLISARARQKDAEDLSKAEREFATYFLGPHTGESLMRIVVLTCVAGAVLIGTGIFALRTATEGLIVGVVFGCFALALTLASFYNSFDTADDVAELFDNLAAETGAQEQKAVDAAQAPVIKQRAGAVTEAKSIRAENEKEGKAAAAGIRRRLFAVLGGSPGVAGNGAKSARGAVSRNGHKKQGTREIRVDKAA